MSSLKKSIDISKVDFNTGLFLQELEKRGVKLSYVGDTKVVTADYKGHKELLFDIFSSLYSFSMGWIVGDKILTKKILQRDGLSVAKGHYFTRWQKDKALAYASKIKYPVVLKPINSGHGDYVYSGISSAEELQNKMELIIDEHVGSGYFMIEKHVDGKEYRIFYTKNNFLAVVHRVPAHVLGDGKQPLVTLIQEENYRRMNPRDTCLCEIKMDDVMFDNLEKNKTSIMDIPAKGEDVQLRLSSNVSKGGDCVDVTDDVHTSVVNLAKKVLKIFGDIPYVGLDLICEDISTDLDKQDYVICELNVSPGLSLHMKPGSGKQRNVSGALVDLLYPETIK